LSVNQASDAPQEVGDIFQSRAALAQENQVTTNLQTIQAQVNTADSSVQSAIQLLQNASTLGAEGAGTTVTPAEQATLATQVQGIISQLVGIANTQVGGVYIFSGDQSGSPSYQVDPSSSTGVDRLITPSDTEQVADPSGITFAYSQTAESLFDNRDSSDNPTAQNAFAALSSLQSALQSGNSTAITQAIASVNTATDWVNQQAGFYGAAENRISSSLDLAQKFQLQTQTTLGNLQDANVATVTLQLTQASTDMDAALAAQAKQPTTSLFDYLPLG
jgi:flagellar hook-associated protein 3 FlgL